MAPSTVCTRALKFVPLFKNPPFATTPLSRNDTRFLVRLCSTSTNTATVTSAPGNQNEVKNYSVTEVKIPCPGGVIAGKLWESTQSGPETGATAPPIICVHGWLDNAGSFDALLPLLMTGGNSSPKFFAFDLPGHGFTTYCPLWFYDAHVEGVIAIERVLRHFGWEKVSYLGHSMGGIIGFVFSAFYPDHVHKLVALENIRPLQSYPLIAVLKSSFNLVFEVEEREKLPRRAYPFEVLVQKFREGRQNTISEESCRILLKRGAVQVDGKDGYHYSYNFRTLIPGQEGRFSAALCSNLTAFVKSPICYIKADPGNVYDSELELSVFLKNLEESVGSDQVERHLTPGTHHFHLDNPQPIAEIVKRFLDL